MEEKKKKEKKKRKNLSHKECNFFRTNWTFIC